MYPQPTRANQHPGPRRETEPTTNRNEPARWTTSGNGTDNQPERTSTPGHAGERNQPPKYPSPDRHLLARPGHEPRPRTQPDHPHRVEGFPGAFTSGTMTVTPGKPSKPTRPGTTTTPKPEPIKESRPQHHQPPQAPGGHHKQPGNVLLCYTSSSGVTQHYSPQPATTTHPKN